MARGTGVDFSLGDLVVLGCLFIVLPGCGICLLISLPIVATILFATRDPGQDGRVAFFIIAWSLVGLVILVSLFYCCLAEWWERRNRLYLQREAHADAQRWADADLSQDRDFPDFGDVGVVEVARPQVAANLAANVGVDAEAFLNNEVIRQDLAADEDHVLPYVATRARLWGLFFDQVFNLGSRYIAMGLVPPNDLAEVAPWVALGIPGAVVAELALRSIRDDNVGGLTLQNGSRISNRFRPRVGAGTELWEPQMRLQASVAVADLTDEEAEYFVALCFFCGQPLMAARVRPETLEQTGARHGELMRLTALALRVALGITTLQGYADHFVTNVTGLALLENNYQGGGGGGDGSRDGGGDQMSPPASSSGSG